MLKPNQLLAPRRFVAHGAVRVQSLEGQALASFRSRAIAFVVDLLVLNLLMAAGSVLWSHAVSSPVPDAAGTVIDLHTRWAPVFAVKVLDHHTWWVLLVVVVYFATATYLGRGQTPGKRLMRIRVASLVHERISLWHCIERALGYAASSLELGFGFLQYFIHPNAQTVHDRMAETIVVSERPAPQ
ncbi:MAG TPA: RDD family protein [Burkholderiaceae bacterium]|nr:RDD family protein [Burkholderiaceae bacterium]